MLANGYLFIYESFKIMKIVLLITGLGVGGAENQVVNLADEFASRGHKVLLIAMTGNPVVLPKNKDVQLNCLRMNKSPFKILTAYLCARNMLRKFKPDIVHSHMAHANIFARLLRVSVAIPRLICTAHNTNEGGALRMWGYRLTDYLADITTNVSQEAVDCFVKYKAVSAERILVVPNGIDCARFSFDSVARKNLRQILAVPDEVQVLLAVGRFSEQKDYSNLLTAFAALCNERTDSVLWIAGTGAERPIFEAQAKKLNIEDKVIFLGLRHDIPALMSAADIFTLSSAWEGFPLVVGEAMACKLIVVSTDAGGIREWLGGLGYVVPIKNSAALSKALLQGLEMSALDRELQRTAARERVMQHYSLAAVVTRWLEIYNGNYAVNRVALTV